MPGEDSFHRATPRAGGGIPLLPTAAPASKDWDCLLCGFVRVFFFPPLQNSYLTHTHSYFYTEFILQTRNQLGTLKSKQRTRRAPDDITEETQGGRQTRREPVSSQRKVTERFLSLYSAYSLQQTSTWVSPSTLPHTELIK